MQLPSDGQVSPAGSAGGGDSVRIEDFSQLAALGTNVSALQEHAARAQRRLQSAVGSAVAVGAYPAGQAFASHHDAVAEVMASTMQAMGVDIETFGSNIVASAHSWRDGDENAAGCLRALGTNLSAPDVVNDTFDSARDDHATSLADVTIDPDEAQAGGASEQTIDALRDQQGSGGDSTQIASPSGGDSTQIASPSGGDGGTGF